MKKKKKKEKKKKEKSAIDEINSEKDLINDKNA